MESVPSPVQPAVRRLRVTRQDTLIAVAALAGGLLLLAVHAYVRWSDDWDPGLAWRALPLLGMCAAVPFRRTAPLPALAWATPFSLLDAAMGVSFAVVVLYGDALYAAAVYGRRRHTGEWLLGATAAVTVVLMAVVGVGWRSFAGAVITGAVAGVSWAMPVMTAMAVREHREKAEAQRLRAEQMARLAELDRRAAVAAERARMARELHDVIANHLSAVALHSSAVLKMPHLDRAAVQRSMEVIRDNSVQGLEEMRRMIGLLRDDGEPDPAAAPRLADLGDLVARTLRSDLDARLTVAGRPRELPAAVELAAYRIVQESLTNALKHAGPGRAEVLLEYRPGGVAVTVRSPLGPDGSRLPGAGSGLVGMRERAAVLDGTFTAGPEGPAWVVRAELPAAPPACDAEDDDRVREATA
ncbi:two-component sensor histidine kinase [Actinomadura sp. NBRC 104425]|uniref:sensor histidine kinase n=1 Tax=Actinomadura sp. NBRC 104425 TaxID=3032204 RepID=UPI0024A2861E|nr:histidine kinase [Actinomadura sp. NBRC 104425]GLZ13851.1 two-component sensor histidine kinase [Actinomadura sp. NBRC 104425]